MKVYEEDSTFEWGKSILLREGKDATIFCSGYCVSESLKAAQLLEEEGISVRVVNAYCWKPIEEEAVLSAARDTGAIVTAENHNVINGLGSAVAEILVKHKPVPMEMIGAQDECGEVGMISYLSERFQMNAPYIADGVRRAIARK